MIVIQFVGHRPYAHALLGCKIAVAKLLALAVRPEAFQEGRDQRLTNMVSLCFPFL